MSNAEHSDVIIVVDDAIGTQSTAEAEEEENLDLILSGPDFDSIYYQGAEHSGEVDEEENQEIHS